MTKENNFQDGWQPKNDGHQPKRSPNSPPSQPDLIAPKIDVGAGYQPTTSEGDTPGNPPKKP